MSAASSVRVDSSQGEILREELDRFAAVTGAGSRYIALRAALEEGEVPPVLAETFGRFLEGVLESGSVRRTHGPGAEQSLLDLYRQTERGAAVAVTVAEVNRALSALEGQTLGKLVFRPTVPGAFQLAVETDRCHLRLEIDRRGVGARDVALTA